MATINKQSVRDEFDRIKASFDEQVKSGKVPAETAALVNTLIMLFGIILSIFMEKQTKKNSANSSIPSSQTDPDETTLVKNKKKQLKNADEIKVTTIANTRTVETIALLNVFTCQNCGHDLSNTECQCIERRTRIDIVFEKTAEHFDAEVKKCQVCNSITKAVFPESISGPLQYGNGIKAYVIQLLVAQMLSLSRASEMVASLIGQTISEATLLNYIMRLHQALLPWEENAKKQLLTAKCIHTDETSFKVDQKNHWIHVYSTGEITLRLLHQKRGSEAIEEFGIIPSYSGVIVHDCWASYLSYEHLDHGLCGSHLLRELQFIIDANAYRWAKNMRRLLRRACKMVSESEDKSLSSEMNIKLIRIYEKILQDASKELPPIPAKADARRGKIAKSDAHNLWERLDRYQNAVLLFASNPDVPFTNNRAERDLRMTKVKQKISGCFRTQKYAEAYCRISSYLQTMNNKGVNPLVAVSWALSGKFDF
jgi:transposase